AKETGIAYAANVRPLIKSWLSHLGWYCRSQLVIGNKEDLVINLPVATYRNYLLELLGAPPGDPGLKVIKKASGATFQIVTVATCLPCPRSVLNGTARGRP